MAKLNEKQARFCLEYIVDYNATEAAKRAGYTGKGIGQTAHRLLSLPHVKEELARLRTRTENRTLVTADRVIQELAKVAFANVQDLFHPDGRLKDISELDPDTAAAVQSFKYSAYTHRAFEIKMHDKMSALDKLCRRLGLYEPERHVIAGDPDGAPIQHEHKVITEETVSEIRKRVLGI